MTKSTNFANFGAFFLLFSISFLSGNILILCNTARKCPTSFICYVDHLVLFFVSNKPFLRW